MWPGMSGKVMPKMLFSLICNSENWVGNFGWRGCHSATDSAQFFYDASRLSATKDLTSLTGRYENWPHLRHANLPELPAACIRFVIVVKNEQRTIASCWQMMLRLLVTGSRIPVGSSNSPLSVLFHSIFLLFVGYVRSKFIGHDSSQREREWARSRCLHTNNR